MFHALGSILHRPAKRQKLAAEALRTVGNKSKGGSAATSVKEQRDTQHSSAVHDGVVQVAASLVRS